MGKTVEEWAAEVEARAEADGPRAIAHLRSCHAHAAMSRTIFVLRTEQGLTQQELAKLSGINQSEISRIESGRANPTISTIGALLSQLDARIDVVPAKPARKRARKSR